MRAAFDTGADGRNVVSHCECTRCAPQRDPEEDAVSQAPYRTDYRGFVAGLTRGGDDGDGRGPGREGKSGGEVGPGLGGGVGGDRVDEVSEMARRFFLPNQWPSDTVLRGFKIAAQPTTISGPRTGHVASLMPWRAMSRSNRALAWR